MTCVKFLVSKVIVSFIFFEETIAMSASFIWNFVQTVWERMKSYYYSTILSIPTTFFDYFYATCSERFLPDATSSKETADEFIYNRTPINEFNIYIVTWNVDSKPPPSGSRLLNLLRFDDDCEQCKRTNPDIYAIGLQEVNWFRQKLSGVSSSCDLWIDRFTEVLSSRDYVLVKCKQLQSIMLLCFVKRCNLLQIRNIETEQTKLGFGGKIVANKGAISIRLSIADCEICFVNCHFAADEHNPEFRILAYENVIQNHHYNLKTCQEISNHCLIFWFGDLNFRLTWNNKLTPEEIEKCIHANERDVLLELDELRNLMKLGKVFHGFSEKLLNFPPTYKFENGRPFYDLKRKPAWTDRILYKVKTSSPMKRNFHLKQEFYTSHAECDMSDHRPVASEFNVKFLEPTKQKANAPPAPSKSPAASNMKILDAIEQSTFVNATYEDTTQKIVQFDSIRHWNIEDENFIEYTLPAGFCEHPDSDWIGLYRSDFDDLSKYIAYQYVGQPEADDENSNEMPSTSTDQRNHLMANGTRRRRIRFDFSEISVNIMEDSKYVLLYIEREEGGAMGVAGISNSFSALKSSRSSYDSPAVEIKKER